MTTKEQKRQKNIAAKQDVEAAIKKHGLAAVRWVINKLTEESRLRKELAKDRAALNAKIAAIKRKLSR